MVLGIILLIFWMIVIPIGIGMCISKRQEVSSMVALMEDYVIGIAFLFALFELIAVPATFFNGSLTFVTATWSSVCLLLVIGIGIYFVHKNKYFTKFNFNKSVEINWWGIGAIVLIIFQIGYVTLHMHIDDDDAWYVGTAVTSYTTDTINRIYPYTGELMTRLPNDYALSPFPIFFAMLGKLTIIHPTILMHTLVPIIFICLSYMIYYLIANMLYKENKINAQCMIFFIALFNMFGFFSVRSASAFLLFRIWQGKAVLCNILIPLTIYLFIKCIQKNSWKQWVELVTCVTAATMVSSMGVFLVPVLLGIMSLVVLLTQKKFKQMVYTIICILPCIIQFGIFYFALLRQ